MEAAAAGSAAGGPAVTGDLTPLSLRQRRRIERAVDEAEESTGLQLCVCVGSVVEDARAQAEAMFVGAGLDSRPAILVLVAPEQRHVEIVTAPSVRPRLSDQECAAAIETMAARFRTGDLPGGIVAGVRRLAAAAGAGVAPPDAEELPDFIA